MCVQRTYNKTEFSRFFLEIKYGKQGDNLLQSDHAESREPHCSPVKDFAIFRSMTESHRMVSAG